jgi:hypothetical protein
MPTATSIAASSGGEQFDGSVLILLVWSVVSIALLSAGGSLHRPSVKVPGLASLGGLIGAIGGVLVGLGIKGTHLGTNYFAYELGTICAGIGWVAGAMLGAFATRDTRPASRSEVWVLRVTAALFLLAAVIVARSIIVPAFFQVEGVFYLDASSISSLRRLILLDGAIAAVICLVLSLRGRSRVTDEAQADLAPVMSVPTDP